MITYYRYIIHYRRAFSIEKRKKTLQKVIHLSWKTPDKSLGKWLEKSKDENVLKKDFELPHVDKGVCDNF